MIYYDFDNKRVSIKPYRSYYTDNNNTAIILICDEGEYKGETYSTLSVNIRPLPENRIAVDTNNCPNAEKFIKENNLGKPVGITLKSGFCAYPIYEIDLDKIEPYPEF